jgi:ubiquinone/menaquinone biosynthesis C-methylase UbiE
MNEASEMAAAISPNQDAIEAWNTVLFDKFCRFRHTLTHGLAAHGDAALARHPPAPGAHVLDIGCGFGDTTLAIGKQVGVTGQAIGVDAAARFIDSARSDADAAGARNVRFEVRDVENDALGGPYDLAFARFGTMFFANPVAALRNVASSLKPGGELCMVVWRKREDSPAMYLAQQIVEERVPRADKSDAVTCGPGPFSMAGADLVSTQLKYAGYERIAFERHDAPISVGRDLDDALAFAMTLGPAGEHLRLAGEAGEAKRPLVMAALREAFAPFVKSDGVWLLSSTWIITARVPHASGQPLYERRSRDLSASALASDLSRL